MDVGGYTIYPTNKFRILTSLLRLVKFVAGGLNKCSAEVIWMGTSYILAKSCSLINGFPSL